MTQIKIVASANMAQAQSQFAALTSQIAAMNAEMAKSAIIPTGSPAGFAKQARAAGAVSTAYSHALASSGAFRVEQLKINDAVTQNTKLLEKQKLKFGEVFGKKSRDMMRSVYREQLAMQQSVTRMQGNLVGDGRQAIQMGIPTQVHDSWDNLNNKIGFFRTRLASASAEMVNWGKNTQWAGRQLMAGISMPIAAFGAAAGVMAYQVDKELTRIAKVYDTTADQNSTSLKEQGKAEMELAQLREQGMKTAQEAAHAYGSAVTETLQVQADLASTGQRGAALQQSTNEVMRIATLGEIDHGQATQALISLQAILGHTVKQTADDFNYLNAIENATSLTTDDFTAAIPRALGPMKEMGGTLQDLGILMVAMKERGIAAGEGANAIKAMMQRLYRPSVAVRQEWQAMAGVDPMEFIEKGSGNVMEILPMVADAVRDVDRASRVKMLSGLFGTYQVQRMSAMLKGLDDMNAGIGQVSRVAEVNAQSAQQNAQVAAQELATQAESASGRFKRAWEGMRAELAELGEPFLEVASKFLQLSGAVLSFINNMPSWAKKGLVFGAMLAALIGPAVMLIGLFANFAGNIGKFVAWSLKAVTSFEFLNKAQWASKVSSALAEKGFIQQATAAEILESQLKGLTLAAETSAIAMSRLAGVPLSAQMAAQIAARDAAPLADNRVKSSKQTNSQFAAYQLASMTDKNGQFRDPQNRMRIISAETAALKANEAVIMRTAKAEAVMKDKAGAIERIKSKTAGHMSGMAISGAAMAISMGLMSGAAGDTGAEIGKWVMIASVLAPTLSGLTPVVAAMGTRFKSAAASATAAAAASAATSLGTAKAAGAAATLGAGVRGVAAGFSAALGPIGWVALGLTATAGIIATIVKHNNAVEEAQRKQLANQAALTGQTEAWAAAQTDAVNSWRRFQDIRLSEASSAQIDESVAFYKSDEQKDATASFNDDNLSAAERGNILMLKYVNAIKTVGMTASEAQNEIAAFLNATGKGLDESLAIAKEFGDELGNLESVDWIQMFEDTNESTLTAAIAGNLDSVKNLGLQAGKIFMEGFLDPSNTVEDRQAYYESLKSQVLGPWEDIAKDINSVMSELSDLEKDNMMGDYGLQEGMNGEELRAAYLALSKEEREGFGTYFLETGTGRKTVVDDINKAIVAVDEFESATVSAAAETYGLGEDVDRVGELARSAGMEALLLTLDQADAKTKELADKMAVLNSEQGQDMMGDSLSMLGLSDAAVESMVNSMTDAEEESALIEQNARNAAFGYAQADNYADSLANWTGEVSDSTAAAADNAIRLSNNLKGAKFDFAFEEEDWKSMLQSGYAGVQQELSDMISDDFSSRMESAVEANVSYWDDAIERMQDSQEVAQENMDKRHESEQDKFENRWERRTNSVEKSYDARIFKVNEAIEAEQKAEEIRQKIFEAEQTRLDRLTESANRTIDFNMALQTGDLDEAAKIRNDMDAAAQGWALSDAADRGGSKSERRQERMGDRVEGIEEKKDASLKALEKREEAERKSLERRQENEKKHLEKVQEMNLDALNAQADAAKKAFAAEWDARRESLDDQLDTFKSFVPKNQKQLKAWMDEMDIDYENFGLDVLRPKSDKWGKWFKNSLNSNIRQAGIDIGSSNMWETMGADVAKKMLLGMGFGSMGKFQKFVMTGKLPKNFGKPNQEVNTTPYGQMGRPGQEVGTYHEGGSVMGGAGSGRKGVARTLRGLHPNEVMARLQKEEFVVNKNSAKKYGPQLEAMNKGIYDPSTNNSGVMGGAGSNMVGLMSGVLGTMLSAGIARSMQNAFATKYSQVSATTGKFGSITAGAYGSSSFTAEQLDNAKTIAAVGKSMGASSRDIIIALMTAMQESTLRNLDYGDRDSVGLFQQRDAWGSFAARTNPAESARMFFSGGAQGQRGLFDFPDRGSMSLTEAAQAVQVSAFPDAYAQWEDEARAIFSALRTSSKASSTYVPGPGGSSRPIRGYGYGSIHGSETGFPAVDFAAPTGTPLYAVGDGVISRSEDIRGYEPFRAANGRAQDGFASYGRVIQLRLDSGSEVLYAHLSDRGVNAGQRVRGGSVIGRSGDTGKSTGPHLHFGATNGPLAWLKTGGQTLNDGIAMLHRGETVLTKPLTDDLNSTVRAFGKSSKEILSGRRGGNREGQMEKAKAFARGQVGKPYGWGAGGPESYDCSGIQAAIINVIKGNHPYNRLFWTGSMAEVIPNLGFKRGNGGNSDYSVGWYTGDPGHTSGRIGDMGIESTGSTGVRIDGAAPVSSFPNQWHLPMTSIAAATSTNPKGINRTGRESRKPPPPPWTKEDGLNSSAESWGAETMKAEVAQSAFWTYANAMAAAPDSKAVAKTIAANVGSGSTNKAGLQIGTLNTWVGASSKATISDVSRLIPGADFLGLTEMGTKFGAVKKYLKTKNWGALGGGSRDQSMNMMAYNKATQELLKSGQRKLGDKQANVVGGREKRYANYGLFRDKESGRNTWQVAAHTVPAGRGLNAKNAPLYHEQWGNLNNLVEELSASAPTFVSGDLNVHQGAGNFQTPGNLNEFAASGVDYIFGNKKVSELQKQWIVNGMHTDHGGKALMSNFSLPSHKNGAENIKWDNTLVNVHKKESILTADQSDKFRRLADNIDNVAGGGGNEYNVNVYMTGQEADADQIANTVITKLRQMDNRRPNRRRS